MSTTADLITALKELKARPDDLRRPGARARPGRIQRQAHAGQGRTCRCRAWTRSAARSSSTSPNWPGAWPTPAARWPSRVTLEQERAVVADKKLLLCAICVLSQWTLEQISASYPAHRRVRTCVNATASTACPLIRIGITVVSCRWTLDR